MTTIQVHVTTTFEIDVETYWAWDALRVTYHNVHVAGELANNNGAK